MCSPEMAGMAGHMGINIPQAQQAPDIMTPFWGMGGGEPGFGPSADPAPYLGWGPAGEQPFTPDAYWAQPQSPAQTSLPTPRTPVQAPPSVPTQVPQTGAQEAPTAPTVDPTVPGTAAHSRPQPQPLSQGMPP